MLLSLRKPEHHESYYCRFGVKTKIAGFTTSLGYLLYHIMEKKQATSQTSYSSMLVSVNHALMINP
jgi:hypothetical protein